jgi:hypothetical protein
MTIEEVRAKLQEAEARAAHFQKLASDPNLSLRAALAAHQHYRRNRAAARLYRKALDYEQRGHGRWKLRFPHASGAAS